MQTENTNTKAIKISFKKALLIEAIESMDVKLRLVHYNNNEIRGCSREARDIRNVVEYVMDKTDEIMGLIALFCCELKNETPKKVLGVYIACALSRCIANFNKVARDHFCLIYKNDARLKDRSEETYIQIIYEAFEGFKAKYVDVKTFDYFMKAYENEIIDVFNSRNI